MGLNLRGGATRPLYLKLATSLGGIALLWNAFVTFSYALVSPHVKTALTVLSTMFPRAQCPRSVRIRKSRPVSQFGHTLFITDIMSYIEVTLVHTYNTLVKKNIYDTNRNKKRLFETHSCLRHVACYCAALLFNLSEGNCSEKPVTLGRGGGGHTAFMCMVMLIAYFWLSLLPIPPISLSPPLL